MSWICGRSTLSLWERVDLPQLATFEDHPGRESPQPQHFPPHGANGQPNSDGDETDQEACFPPGSQRHVSAPKQDGSGRGAVVRQTCEEAAEETQYQCSERRWGAEADRDCKEGCIHRADVSCHTRKKIMRVEVGEAETEHTGNPPDAAEQWSHMVAEPFDQAELAEKRRHHHQRSEPDECIPCPMFAAEILPRQDTGQQKRCHR